MRKVISLVLLGIFFVVGNVLAFDWVKCVGKEISKIANKTSQELTEYIKYTNSPKFLLSCSKEIEVPLFAKINLEDLKYKVKEIRVKKTGLLSKDKLILNLATWHNYVKENVWLMQDKLKDIEKDNIIFAKWNLYAPASGLQHIYDSKTRWVCYFSKDEGQRKEEYPCNWKEHHISVPIKVNVNLEDAPYPLVRTFPDFSERVLVFKSPSPIFLVNINDEIGMGIIKEETEKNKLMKTIRVTDEKDNPIGILVFTILP